MNSPQPSEPLTAPTPERNWWPFWVALLAPPVLTTLLALLQRDGTAAATVAIYGTGVSALYCGFWTAIRFFKNAGLRLLLGLVFAVVFYAVGFV